MLEELVMTQACLRRPFLWQMFDFQSVFTLIIKHTIFFFSSKGIFPASYIHLKEAIVEGKG